MNFKFHIDNKNNSEPCVLEEHLLQTRVCNRKPCRSPLWQIGTWSECISVATENGPICGKLTGEQTRNVHCAIDPGNGLSTTMSPPYLFSHLKLYIIIGMFLIGYPVRADRCDGLVMPGTDRSCDARCPVDCAVSAWSDWSQCSQSCSVRTVKTRTQYITQLPQYGGKPCHEQADENGNIRIFYFIDNFFSINNRRKMKVVMEPIHFNFRCLATNR